MPTTINAAVLADPIGAVVDLVLGREPALDRSVITEVVSTIAGGRAKRRRLAQTLLDRPGVLADGRSPAPRVVGDLLIALRNAGTTTISLPVCADCGRGLLTLHRRGEDWYCAVCGPRPRRCASCGQERLITTLDRQGRPRCDRCPDDDDRDPLVLLADEVTTLDPSLTAQIVTAAAARVFSRPAKLRQLAWVIEDAPTLLTGDGALAPIPGVLRLIDELCDAGAQTITRPACPRCHRVIRLHRRITGQWLCRNCVAKSRAQPCARCGVIREAAARDEQGRRLCPHCFTTDPANQEQCIACGRKRPVSTRTPDGPTCPTCRQSKTMTCTICGRHAPCVISKTTNQPWCYACQQRWARCSRCGQVGPIYGGTRIDPLCGPCTRPDPTFWHPCPTCGRTGQIHHSGPCTRCCLDQRLKALLGDDAGQIPPNLQALYQALADTDRPSTVDRWLNKSAAPTILRQLAGQQLTHQTLDDLPTGKPVEHLRSVLVAIGTLPHRDEHMARLQRWITRVIAERPDPDERKMLHRYAIWHVVRRLRGRLADADTTHDQTVAARRNIKAAIVWLVWLAAHDRTLATASQGDLDAWLSDSDATHRADVGNFVRWARKHKLTRLDFAAARWGGPSGIIDTETRWEQARWLLHDDTVKPDDRLAGLLVLLYAQRPATLSRFTLDHVHIDDDQVRLRLGSEPIVLPEPLASLIRQVAATRHGHAAIGDQGTSPWLFPGGQPGRPISAFRIAERLRELGIRPGQSRNTALFQLATDLPAALLARMLGIHIAVAVAWQRASAGDWTNYAAEVSRRTTN